MSLKSYLAISALIAGCIVSYIHATPVSSSGTAQDVFQFWYDPWKPDATLKKMEVANVIIGVPASAIPEIHRSGRRALQYVTYYQSVLNSSLLKGRQDLSNVGFQSNGEFERSAFGGQDNFVLCPNSVELRARIIRALDASLEEGFDGYFVDNTFLDPSAHQICSAKHQHVRQDLAGGRAYLDLLAAVRAKLKQKKPDAILISNPGNPRWIDEIAPGSPSIWDISDLVLWESYGYTSYRGQRHDRWKSTIENSFSYADMPDKRAKLLVLSYPEDVSQARFSYAVARIFGFKWTANLGDSFQNTAKEGGEFGAFWGSIPGGLGEPLGALPDKGNSLLHRAFQHGEAFANIGTSPQTISIPSSSMVYIGDQTIETISSRALILEPATAAIVIKHP